MANVLRTSPFGAPFAQLPSILSPNSQKPSYVSFRQSQSGSIPYLTLSSLRFSHLPSLRFAKFVPLASPR
ncbi:protein GrpE [Prunus yedoensis var. nudiflora]|uniref:Protein GrpE n=1 Tax=Prunus yedoensis var. nudiflora TaxID=2094558 RepID=A0A314UQQ5_PRUYE|nr:protein GrpE [Prunus yedoensis var. nudiflora]